MKDHAETFGGMDDETLAWERKGQDRVRAIIATLLATESRGFNGSRRHAVLVLRRCAPYSELRRKEILAFASALEDQEADLESIISDSGFATMNDWNEAIDSARRG